MTDVFNMPSVLSTSEIRHAFAAYYDYDIINYCDAVVSVLSR